MLPRWDGQLLTHGILIRFSLHKQHTRLVATATGEVSLWFNANLVGSGWPTEQCYTATGHQPARLRL